MSEQDRRKDLLTTVIIGTFIALGCGVAMFAGLMSWWEGRKVKKIEGPEIKIIQEV